MLKSSVLYPIYKISYRLHMRENTKYNVNGSYLIFYPWFPLHTQRIWAWFWCSLSLPSISQPLWCLFKTLWSPHLHSVMLPAMFLSWIFVPHNIVPDTEALNKHMRNEFWKLNKNDHDIWEIIQVQESGN